MGTVTVRELLASLPDTSIYAGQSGIDKQISTISFIDSPSSVNWLNGGEVILTTAFLYKEHVEMQVKFVQKLIEMGVVALGIKIGRYISELPAEAIEHANKNGFPIFGICYDSVWSEIFSVFHALRLGKTMAQSILSTEMITFDKLFRSSSWGKEAIQSTFLQCIKLPAVIVDSDYKILCHKGDAELGELEAYCLRRRRANAGDDVPSSFVTHARPKHNFYDTQLYDTERLILCFPDTTEVRHDEIVWITSLYESIRKKNKFMQDVPAMWKNFILECIVEGLDENFRDYAQLLRFEKEITGTILLFQGDCADSARDEFKRCFRSSIRKGETIIHDVQVDDEIIMLYAECSQSGVNYFSTALRGTLQKVSNLCEGCRISVGSASGQIEEFKLLYRQAKAAREMSDIMNFDEGIVFYRDFQIFDLLFKQNFDFDEIALLKEQVTTFDACTTLEVYLESGNPKKAAERQFIHDNTMRYRINKLENCLNMDLSKPLNRTILLLKVKLWRLAGGT